MVPGKPSDDIRGYPPIYLVGDPATGKSLADKLSGDRRPVEVVPPDSPERLNAPVRGVVCLPPGAADRSPSDLVARVPEGFDCPVAAVGANVNARVAYRTGATEVVPLSPTDHTELVADRVREIVDSPGNGQRESKTDTDPSYRGESGTDQAFVDALSAAFPDYAFVYDADGRYLDVMMGRRTDESLYTDEELLGRSVHDLLEEATADRIVEGIREALSTGNVQTIEYAIDRSAGTSWYRARIAPLAERYEGHQAAVLVARDITGRKERERDLRRERERRSALFEELGEPVVEVSFDEDRAIVRALNDAFVDVFGADADEIVGDPLDAHIVPETDAETAKELNRRGSEGERIERELQRETADGMRMFLFRSVPFTVGGDQRAYAIYYDITERKRQQERFQAFIEHSTDVITVLSPDGTYQYQSPASERVVGYEAAELLGENAFEYIHPEDRESLMETFAEAVENPELTPTVEYRFRHANGSWRWLESIGNNQLDNPAIEGFVVNSRDITGRKEREQELERAQRRFDAVFNAPSALVTLLDTDGNIEEISDAAVALVPESREAICGRSLWEGPWFESDPDLQDRLRETVERALDGESARIEMVVPEPDRELVVDAMFEPVTDDDGELRGVLGIARDVTERHRNQRIRRQLLSSAREMMGTRSREELAEIISRAASSVLGNDLNVVYITDDHENESGAESLSPAAWTDRIEDLFDDPPEPTGAGPVSEAYRCGDPAIYDTLTGATDGPAEHYEPVESLIALPIGDHGVLAVGGTDPAAFAEADIDRYRLLTVSAATAFDRLERTLDLQRYETLFETVQDRMYVLDEDGHIELISDPLAETIDYDSDDLVGKHVSTVVTDETAREVERLILDLLVTPEQVSNVCEGTLLTRDGTETPVEIELSVLPHEGNFQGTAGVVRDISERRQREEELRVFQRAITEAGIGLAMYGPDGCFEYVNDHYADLLSRSRESLEGTAVWETVDSLGPGVFESYWEALDPGETEKQETEHVRGDGSTVPVETVTTAVDIDGVRRHILTVQDITERRERRQQAQALHRIFRHNLRNDLTVLFGHASMLAEELPDEFESNIETVTEKTESLIDLTETATEARKILDHDTSREPIDAIDLIAKRVSDIQSTYEATVETDLPDERYVRADSMLGIAIEHLLTNAIEHNDADEPQVWARVFQAPDREDWIVIEVADNGPGVPDIERETFAEGQERQIQHSVGLGLWIVSWIISRYGGDLSFQDREPRGTCIQIALPAADDAVERQHTEGPA